MHPTTFLLSLIAVLGVSHSSLHARPPAAPPAAPLTDSGKALEKKYAAILDDLRAQISRSLPDVKPATKSAFTQSGTAVVKATSAAEAAQAELGKIGTAKALIGHAQGKWIGGAEKGIAAATEALKKATTPAEREAAAKDLAHWQKNKEDGIAALKERQANYDALQAREPELKKAARDADAALQAAIKTQRDAAAAILRELAPLLDEDRADPLLAKCCLLTAATPSRLAAFAQQSPDHAAMIDALLGDATLIIDMLSAGGAKFDEYGRAMEILTAIRKAAPQVASDPVLQKLALATSLEHARPIRLNLPAAEASQGGTVDPLNRFLHYRQALENGELDPAFKTLTAWEMRMAVNCDSPDEILVWGREMLRTYRPDHIYNPDYGWRYISAVRTEVPYGSQNVKLDDPALQQHQNIIMNGGVCGRRAFFGRFILRSFGIPTWGVTQRAHAAVSHWTPKGWVVNLGAGYSASWWDKDEVPMSGTQFLVETQARAHADGFKRVLRARWVSRILGEESFNERQKREGGFWSSVDRLCSLMLSEKAAALSPLGQELAEANEREQKLHSADVSAADREIRQLDDGSLVIPAVAHGKAQGKASAMRSYGEGMQLHALGGFSAPYEIEVRRAGTYQFSARIATVQKGQVLAVSINGAPASESPVPYTLGLWQQTPAITLNLKSGKNTLQLGLKQGSRGVTIKDLTLKPQP
ncbi:MAG: hypothetical protein MUF31_16220 [Akkermansiaceae bacterium]|jgi:hypothetical protein|nr:hypothetical protein [Akkermansiaceae bacterium]